MGNKMSEENKLGHPSNALMLMENQKLIANMAMSKDVDPSKMKGLFDLQIEMMAKQAEINFNNDLHRLQVDMPRITKDAKILHNGKFISDYATYEKIDEVIRPLLSKHGFGLRFNSEPNGNTVIITATLSHRDGHSITDKIPLGFDTSGAKNNVQAVGSTIAYGKRYLVGMLLNLVFEGEDDDGFKSGYTPITADQAGVLKDMIRETGTDVVKFLNTMTGTKSVDEIAAKDFNRVYSALVAKKNKVGGAL